MSKTKIGLWYKGQFCPLWSGVYLNMWGDTFLLGGLADLSRTMKSVVYDAGVVVWYED
jgi:hypothetical protein